jgi:S1-C subfamily serine protease
MVLAMKTGPLITLLGILVFGVLSIASIRWIDQQSTQIPDQSKAPRPSPASSLHQDSSITSGTVVLQTFSGSTLIQMAAATIITSDGLLITTAQSAPYGSGSYLYQVVTANGEVIPAQRVAYDAVNGLVLLKIQTTETGAVSFDDVEVRVGDEVRLVGATVVVSQYVPVILPGDIVYEIRGHTRISADRSLVSFFSGARVIDLQGRFVGLLSIGSSLGVVSSGEINAFLNRYLSSFSKE